MNMSPVDESPRRTLKLTIAYDGREYAGWQIQPDQPSIQQSLESALARVTRAATRPIGSGRTDAGVHALAQVCSARVDSDLDADTLRRAINANLPSDICVTELCDAADDFHALRDATGKRYRYLIYDRPERDVFLNNRAWWVRRDLSVARLEQGAQRLLGEHDYSSFEAAGAPRKTSVRVVRELSVQRRPFGDSTVLSIEIEANGFLYNMVRNIVGSLVDVGSGKQSPEWLGDVLRARDRRAAAATAPPEGLYLISVTYGPDQTPEEQGR
ncbi:MAG: tRNA pseudouridine(38-40) synthase TruA [Pirellulaceae bacterium]|nr:tRNA pseudouridine(38-40) synthase TruA [Pirellulaceae bacterium]